MDKHKHDGETENSIFCSLCVSICPSAAPLFKELSFFCRMVKGKARRKIKPWCCWDEKAKCRSVTAGETEPFFSLKWNREGKKSIVAGGNVSNAVRSFWAKKEESAADNSQCFISFVSPPTDVSCHTYFVNPPFTLFLFVLFEPHFHKSFTQPYQQQAKLFTLQQLAPR